MPQSLKLVTQITGVGVADFVYEFSVALERQHGRSVSSTELKERELDLTGSTGKEEPPRDLCAPLMGREPEAESKGSQGQRLHWRLDHFQASFLRPSREHVLWGSH